MSVTAAVLSSNPSRKNRTHAAPQTETRLAGAIAINCWRCNFIHPSNSTCICTHRNAIKGFLQPNFELLHSLRRNICFNGVAHDQAKCSRSMRCLPCTLNSSHSNTKTNSGSTFFTETYNSYKNWLSVCLFFERKLPGNWR